MNPSTDRRRSAPSALRNRTPILDVLRPNLPPSGTILEIASGSGEHVLHFARETPHLVWQPSDPSCEARASIAAWLDADGTPNIRPPVELDVSSSPWPVAEADAIVAINLVHISPWPATIGLMRGAGALLPTGGLLYLYGPYRREGRAIEPSNAAFDADLKARNPEWGLREVAEVATAAERNGLRLAEVVEMPANNLSLLFRRVGRKRTPTAGRKSKAFIPFGQATELRSPHRHAELVSASILDAAVKRRPGP